MHRRALRMPLIAVPSGWRAQFTETGWPMGALVAYRLNGPHCGTGLFLWGLNDRFRLPGCLRIWSTLPLCGWFHHLKARFGSFETCGFVVLPLVRPWCGLDGDVGCGAVM